MDGDGMCITCVYKKCRDVQQRNIDAHIYMHKVAVPLRSAVTFPWMLPAEVNNYTLDIQIKSQCFTTVIKNYRR